MEEMIKTLKSYFIISYKQEDFYKEFHDIEIYKGEGNIKETFPQFATCF
jgi:hypothetical protein